MTTRTDDLPTQAAQLMQGKHFDECVALLLPEIEAGRDLALVMPLALRAAIRARDANALIPVLKAARQLRAVTPEVRRMVIGFLLPSALEQQTRILALLFGKAPATVEEGLSKLPSPLLGPDAIRRLLHAVRAVSLTPIVDRPGWIARLTEGHKRAALAKLQRRAVGRRNDAAQADPLLAITARNPEVVQDLVTAGRSVLLLMVHGQEIDPLQPIVPWLTKNAIGISRINNGMKPADKLPDFNVDTSAPDLAIQFAKLCKLMRKGPRVVRILPDGPKGNSFSEIEVGGSRLQVGLGGARLAYFGKSALVFAYPQWTATGLEIDYWRGPDVIEGQTTEEVDALFTTYYRDSLIKVLRGDPLHFGVIGGYWARLGKEIAP
jgi:hypothetical protein